ncbi:MAG: hypothetical protein LBN41_04285 [Enterobacteriaceae bacterium]|jgi:hypothetical protein|nr:hypothetical protein [Enterobacteriaceae bacterium]
MAIPKTVANGLISGVVGEISHYGPTRVVTAVLNSSDETGNLFGRAYTYVDDANETVAAGGTGSFAGILINPKAYAIEVPYARNGTVGEFITMGEVYVQLTAGVAAINSPVVYTSKGDLTAKAAPEAGDNVIGFVTRHIESVETPLLCAIRLTEIPYPVAPSGDA